MIRCEHRHTIETHPKCFLPKKDNAKIIIFDIEMSPIKALIFPSDWDESTIIGILYNLQ